jgi:hypothetical protein
MKIGVLFLLTISVAFVLSDIVIRPSDMLLDGTDYNFYPGMDDHLTSDTMVSTGFEAPVQPDVPASDGAE